MRLPGTLVFFPLGPFLLHECLYFRDLSAMNRRRVAATRSPYSGLRHIVCTEEADALRLAHIATHTGHMTILRLLLAKLPADYEAGECGETALHGGVRDGKIDLIHESARRGEDLNATDNYGRTPLMWAIMNGHVNAVRTLVGLGCDVNCRDVGGNTPLVMGIRLGIEEIVNALLAAGADVSVASVAGRNTALHEAISRFASLNIIKKLVCKAPESCLETRNEHGETPLLLSITHSSIQTVQVLLDANVKVNVDVRGDATSLRRRHCTPLEHCLYHIILPLSMPQISVKVSKKKVRNQVTILKMLVTAGARWQENVSTLEESIKKIKSHLGPVCKQGEFGVLVRAHLDETLLALKSPRRLRDLCRQNLRAHYGRHLDAVVRKACFAPYFQDFILTSDISQISCDSLTPFCS